ncbi:MAG: HAD family phosphatase [Chitinophagaceae bacterium]
MKQYKAFLFDLNGTMIDDMHYHVKAWHRIFNELGASISMEEMKSHSYGKNPEVIERVMPGRFTAEEKKVMSIEKEKQYQEEFRPHLALIKGLDTFLQKTSAAGIKMAIGSAAITMNIDFVLDGLNIRHYFDAIVSADDVIKSKPDPETYLKCAAQLNVAPEECLVFEDVPKGTESAMRAGMDCVVITTMHEEDEFDPANVLWVIKDYDNDIFERIRDKKQTA